MNIRFNGGAWLLLGLALLFISSFKELNGNPIVVSAGLFCLLVAGIRGIRRLRSDRNDKVNDGVAENNAAVIQTVYRQLLEDDGKKNDETFAKLCYLILQNAEHADAALKFAKQQASAQGESLSIERVAYSILVGQMYVKKGIEPNQNEKFIAFTAVKKVIGWKGEKAQSTSEDRRTMPSSQYTVTGLGGWMAVFIVDVATWTLVCATGVLSFLMILITGDYNSNADISSLILVGLLLLYSMAVFILGAWLLGLLIKRRKLAIKVGMIFSIVTLGLLWIPYLHESRRVKNTLVR